MKQLKDYLHLYLGCECLVPYDAKDYTSTVVGIESESVFVWNAEGRRVINIRNIKPILRPLSDMTDEEKYDIGEMKGLTNERAAKRFHYLLSKHFDLFGLIEAGLAIDKTTL